MILETDVMVEKVDARMDPDQASGSGNSCSYVL
jgi:hypothetical protein